MEGVHWWHPRAATPRSAQRATQMPSGARWDLASSCFTAQPEGGLLVGVECIDILVLLHGQLRAEAARRVGRHAHQDEHRGAGKAAEGLQALVAAPGSLVLVVSSTLAPSTALVLQKGVVTLAVVPGVPAAVVTAARRA